MRQIEWTPWLVASVALGASYWLVAGAPMHGPLLVAWKGSGVALLALAALLASLRTPENRFDTRLLALVLGCGAVGDVAIEYSLTAGAAAFLLGHAIAIGLYGMHRNRDAAATDRVVAGAILVVVPSVAWTLPTDRALANTVAFYAIGLAGMTAMAWLSRFPRSRVALGALMFAASDLLIFARMGPLAQSVIPRLLIWPLYYGGQFLICVGVLGALSRRSEA